MVDFLIIGPETAVRKDNVFSLIKENVINYGYRRDRKHMLFNVPGSDDLMDVSYVRWFQNLVDIDVPPLVLSKRYADGVYRKYDDESAINIDDYRDIPGDYDGIMGVPICFINRLCRKQFEIIGLKEDGSIDGESRYTRLLIKKKVS